VTTRIPISVHSDSGDNGDSGGTAPRHPAATVTTVTYREKRERPPEPRPIRDRPALRPQPGRDGPDFWPTPPCLTRAFVRHVLPALPPSPIWECAAGDGRLAKPMRQGRPHRVRLRPLSLRAGNRPA
jgi:hypothetical protein